MGCLGVLIFLCVALIIITSVSGIEPDCDPRLPITVVDCNHCRCKQGHLIDCTRYRCNYNLSATEPQDFYLVCVEREVKKEGCNLCMCKNEEWKCAHIPCANIKRRRSIAALQEPCLDGRKMQHDCKECVCEGGKWYCSENSCIVKRQAEMLFQEDLKDVSCAPSDDFEIDCHICQCNPNGVGYTCRESPVCRDPEDSFYSDAWKYLEAKNEADRSKQEKLKNIDNNVPHLEP